jgi:pimeloyl-ACP methyl ester carboxylesterase
MDRLGYDRYGACGGDYGAAISSVLADRHPRHVIGIHLNDVIAHPDPSTFDSMTDVEQGIVLTLLEHARTENGYFEEQSTKPQTLGYGLTDSPVAQCAWIVEKFHRLADFDDDLYGALSRDQVLDNVTLYWLTATGTSSGRLYWEGRNDPVNVYAPLDLPVGCSIFAGEVDRASRRWAEKRFSDIRWWGEVERGGHYPAFEQPDAYVVELRAFYRTVR